MLRKEKAWAVAFGWRHLDWDKPRKAGRWQHALALLAVMPVACLLLPSFVLLPQHRAVAIPKEKSIRRDVITYNSVMAALKNAGQWETTMQLMQLMCAAGMPLRTSTYARG